MGKLLKERSNNSKLYRKKKDNSMLYWEDWICRRGEIGDWSIRPFYKSAPDIESRKSIETTYEFAGHLASLFQCE